MRSPSTGITREGVPIIGMAVLVTLCLALLGWPIPTIIALILTLGIVHFFRDPERVIPEGQGLAVSPADGRILNVKSRPDPVSSQQRPRVSIFMNVFNVHVNRAPVQGSLTHIAYHPGKFLRASLSTSDTTNERNVLVLEDEQGQSWTMVQIAGLIARRIVCWAEVGDSVFRGQRVGLIKFGSRVDLYLPEDYEVRVRPGEHVLAGQTIIAKKRESQSTHV